jgi:hypothetical protein
MDIRAPITLSGKPKTVDLAGCNTTFGEKIYIRWCCIDLLRPPR